MIQRQSRLGNLVYKCLSLNACHLLPCHYFLEISACQCLSKVHLSKSLSQGHFRPPQGAAFVSDTCLSNLSLRRPQAASCGGFSLIHSRLAHLAESFGIAQTNVKMTQDVPRAAPGTSELLRCMFYYP